MVTETGGAITHRAEGCAPTFALSSEEDGGAVTLARYREAVSPVFACRQPAAQEPDAFRCNVRSWHLGTLMIGGFACSALDFERSPLIAAASGIDHILVQLYLDGGFTGNADDRPLVVGAGDICLFDMLGTLRTSASDFANISLMVPRPFFATVSDDLSAINGMVLPGDAPHTALIADYLTALQQRLPHLERREAEAAARALVMLLVTVVRTRLNEADRREPLREHSLPMRIMRHVDANLHDPALGSAMLAQHFNMSRATLYRHFDALGGVSEHIRQRRIVGAAIELSAEGDGRRKLADVAHRWGFENEGSFSRAFKSYFGVTPGMARQHAQRNWTVTEQGKAVRPEQQFTRWLRTLSDTSAETRTDLAR